MALIDLEHCTYFKINLDLCYISDGSLYIDYQVFFNKFERDREKRLLKDLELFDLSKIEKELESLDSVKYVSNKNYYDDLILEVQEKSAFNYFFENKLYLTNSLNFDKDTYINLFSKYNPDYVDLIHNPILLSGHIVHRCDDYNGSLSYDSVYAELKKYLSDSVDDL